MTYERLAGFVHNRTRAPHGYRPVMLFALLFVALLRREGARRDAA